MTDASFSEESGPVRGTLSVKTTEMKRRNAAEKRFRIYGIVAIALGLFFLVVLAVSIVRSGLPAFTHTVLDVEITLTQEQFDDAEGQLFKTKAYAGHFNTSLQELLTEQGISVPFDDAAIERIAGKVGGTMREFYRANPDTIGEPTLFELSAASRVDGYFNGRVTRDSLTESRFLMQSDLDLVG